MTAQQAMAHPWLAARTPPTANSSSSGTTATASSNSISPEVLITIYSISVQTL
jgi:hypothetical protein